jgi:hypothetical protein
VLVVGAGYRRKLSAEWLTGGPPHEMFSRDRLSRFHDGTGDMHPMDGFDIG